jgi:hypothetical protein
VPGIDTAYLAMDTEEGVEVVWNEANFSGSKKFMTQVKLLRVVIVQKMLRKSYLKGNIVANLNS